MIPLQRKFSKIWRKQKRKERVYSGFLTCQGTPDAGRTGCFLLDKLIKVRRLCENCYQYKELNRSDREKLMEVAIYELVLVSKKLNAT